MVPFSASEKVDGIILEDGTVKLSPKIKYAKRGRGDFIIIDDLDDDENKELERASKQIAKKMNQSIDRMVLGLFK